MSKKSKHLIWAIALLTSTLAFSQKECTIIPFPQEVSVEKDYYVLPAKLKLQSDYQGFRSLIKIQEIEFNKLLSLSKTNLKKVNLLYSATISNHEGYQLKISADNITITASGQAGAFYGLKSLQQLIITANQNNTQIPTMTISDEPRYSWRGLMLDESRHFFGKETVKQLLDMMAFHKMNKFHWHLTDEPGWRIEIKKYPKLTTIGGKGNFSDPDAPASYYTQEDIKEIVQYAGERHIEVIPEIDMPGHASAANRAYPEYSGGGNEKHPDFTFHPGKEETYTYLTNILREVADLFPSKYIHIGGDEVHFGNDKWAADPDVKNLMKREGLPDIKAVEYYFLNRMSDSIASLNKTLIGWDEVTGAGLSNKNTMVMWWRHDKKQLLQEAIEADFNVVMCPRRPLYLDFVQHTTHKDGRRWGGFCPLDMIYDFPNKELTGGDYYLSDHILGIQANVWTERMHSKERLQFMIFPRLSAVAESAWTKDENKSYENFILRLNPMLEYYRSKGITFFDVMNPKLNEEITGPLKKK